MQKPPLDPSPPPKKEDEATLFTFAAALAVGAAIAGSAMLVLSLTAHGSNPIFAAGAAVRSFAGGTLLPMSRAIEREEALQKSLGLHGPGGARARVSVVFSSGMLPHTYALVSEGSEGACKIKMALDGSGEPGAFRSEFSNYRGAAPLGADPLLAPAPALALAYLLAHELGHCALGWHGLDLQAQALAVAAFGPGPTTDELRMAREAVLTPFGRSLVEEAAADAFGLAELARRLGDQDWEAFARMLLARRVETETEAVEHGSSDPGHYTQGTLREMIQAGRSRWASMGPEEMLAAALALSGRNAADLLARRPEVGRSGGLAPALAARLEARGKPLLALERARSKR